jgi:flagellar P-ring protein precursor FlgI
MRSLLRFALATALAVYVPAASAQTQKKDDGVRLKEIARIQGVRTNQLLGYGIVVGLPGTGDSRSKLAEDSVRNLLGSLGQRIDQGSIGARNVAAVLVIAEIPPFANKGNRLNAVVSSIGDAKSLEGGVLIQTPLQGGDGIIYGVAQGAVTTGRQSRDRGKTVGSVVNGASIEKDLPGSFVVEVTRDTNEKGEKLPAPVRVRTVNITLNDFDFGTIREAREKIEKALPDTKPSLQNGMIVLEIPPGKDPSILIAEVEDIRVTPRYRARIVINERSGAIVMGGDVRVDPVAVSRGGMDLIVSGAQYPNGIYLNTAEKDKKDSMQAFSGASVQEIMDALNAMGAGIRDVIAIFEALRDSGALHAELIVQ